ncbi:MAG: hypothetical protein ACFHU9_02640 [Fluviicola sp.]
MEDQTLDSTEDMQPKKRPVFILVLCILTWVGSGLTIISAIAGLAQDPTNDYNEMVNTPDAAGLLDGLPSFEDFVMWSNISNASNLITSILCIIGAILMFKLKKVGYYLYVIGGVAFVAVTTLAVNQMMPDALKFVAILTGVLYGLIGAAFIIMYGVNLKHMK